MGPWSVVHTSHSMSEAMGVATGEALSRFCADWLRGALR